MLRRLLRELTYVRLGLNKITSHVYALTYILVRVLKVLFNPFIIYKSSLVLLTSEMFGDELLVDLPRVHLYL
jgi:hypothetical protein